MMTWVMGEDEYASLCVCVCVSVGRGGCKCVCVYKGMHVGVFGGHMWVSSACVCVCVCTCVSRMCVGGCM